MSNKRSISLKGKKTSVSLEPEFWGQVQAIAAERNIATSDFVAEINAANPPNLSSAIRVAVLNAALDRAPATANTLAPELERA